MSWFKTAIVAFAVLTLAACGFTPVYGTHSGAPAALSNIYIENIADREGQYLRNTLMDSFYRSGRPDNPAYTLTVSNYRESVLDMDITSTSTATRRQIRLSADMVLSERPGGTILLRRSVAVINSFNVLESQFSTRISEEDARKNALNDMARRIETQLALYFDRKQ